MALSSDQLASLLRQVATTGVDTLDCDGCFGLMAEFADVQLAGRDVPEALHSVKAHLQYCTCCREEYEALLEGLKALHQDGSLTA